MNELISRIEKQVALTVKEHWKRSKHHAFARRQNVKGQGCDFKNLEEICIINVEPVDLYDAIVYKVTSWTATYNTVLNEVHLHGMSWQLVRVATLKEAKAIADVIASQSLVW